MLYVEFGMDWEARTLRHICTVSRFLGAVARSGQNTVAEQLYWT